MQNFRTLDIWRRSHKLAVALNRVASRLPRRTAVTLSSQMMRSAESIVLNIVEGAAADSRREFARFLQISIRSSTELEAQLQLIKDYGAMKRPKWKAATEETIEIRRMIYSFRATLLEEDRREQAAEREARERQRRPRRKAGDRGDISRSP